MLQRREFRAASPYRVSTDFRDIRNSTGRIVTRRLLCASNEDGWLASRPTRFSVCTVRVVNAQELESLASEFEVIDGLGLTDEEEWIYCGMILSRIQKAG